MRIINWWFRESPDSKSAGITMNKRHDLVRVEIPFIAPDEQEYTIIILDAEDSFDVIINYPNDERECVWSYAKEPA
jgi:hypothetical protein